MKILVINAGSSSVKHSIFEAGTPDPLLKGKIERIGEKNSFPDHQAAMQALFEKMDRKTLGEIAGVGHRVVHGGEKLKAPTVINEAVIAQIKEVGRFVPLHCTPNLIGIEVSQKWLPSVSHVAVFDTAAYASLDHKAFLYGIPVEFYKEHQIRKYGFHGINHAYVANIASKLLKKEKIKVITCHLGNGCSVTAFENGKSKDTSMGLTPLEGLVMGTRSGDIDPSVVLYLIDVLGLKTDQISELLNKKSGLLGLCGSNDMRDIHKMAESGNRGAQIALEIFVYRVQKYVGAYIAALNGVDAIVFTGGIGENDSDIRERIASNFGYISAHVEKEKNRNGATIFSTKDSKVALMNIPANEELVIAREVDLLIKNPHKTEMQEV